MGFAVLLSDVDIVTLQNPFQHLHRDCDVEGMSDGWDNATAYGGLLGCSSSVLFMLRPLPFLISSVMRGWPLDFLDVYNVTLSCRVQ